MAQSPQEAATTPSLTEKADLEASSPNEGDNESTSAPPKPRPLIWTIVCISMYLAAMLYGLDTTIAADVQASVYQDLGEISKLPWIGVGFPMGSVAVILFVGKLFGTFQIKWLLIGFFSLFEIGSALCGAAPTANALIIGRVIAGIGGAGMYIGALTYVGVFTSLRERPLYNALIGLSWGIGAILGPVIGGAFSINTSATWRWAFYINLPLAAVLMPSFVFLFPSYNPQPKLTNLQKIKGLDWAGAFLNATTFVLFIVCVTFSGSTWKWDSAITIALWVLFGLSITSYALQQVFAIFTTEDQRLFPVHFLRSRTMLLLYFTTAAASAASSLGIYYIPLFFQFTKADSALMAAVRLLPFIVTNISFVMINGALLPVVGRYAPWYWPAGAMLLIGGSLMFKVTPATHTSAIYGFEVLIAAGSGLIFQMAYSVAAAKVAAKDVAAAIGFINVAQIGSIAIALSIAGNIFQNVGYINLRDALESFKFTEMELRSALAGADSELLANAPPAIRELVITAVVKTLSTEYALVVAAGALILVCAIFVRWERLQLVPAAVG